MLQTLKYCQLKNSFRQGFSQPIRFPSYQKVDLKRTPDFSAFKSQKPILIFTRYFSTPAIRNVAIIAHVDHGKTTMVDELLKQSGSVDKLTSERVMDSNALEKERGITILAKATSFKWKDTKINLVDTPGHGDFGGEVERILSMVDGVVLLVDATEGPMAQTKFVLSKALKSQLKPIVVLNKMDRIDKVRVDEVETEIYELFDALEATPAQMNYPTLYSSARDGWAIRKRDEERVNMHPLFDTILSYVPPPPVSNESRFSMLVTSIEPDEYLGRIVSGRIYSGGIKNGVKLHAMNRDGKTLEESKVLKIVARNGLQRVILEEAQAGDIVGLAGFSQASVTSTICDLGITQPLKSTPIDPPVLSITMTVNNSPLAGKEGTQCTFPTLKRRLDREVESNVSLQVKNSENREALEICGRGEMQLGILLENLRREGFEFAISPPKVITSTGANGERLEPLEEVTIDVDEQYMGSLIEKMATRHGNFIDTKDVGAKKRLIFQAPSRGLVGFRNELITMTRGSAVYNHLFHSYVPYMGPMEAYKRGCLISRAEGVTTAYSLEQLEERGTLFVGPGTKVYAGMIIGECSREGDIDCNPVKTKQLSNVRTVQKDEFSRLTPPKTFSLEEAISYVKSDELLEITPKSIRLRKTQLDMSKRKKAD